MSELEQLKQRIDDSGIEGLKNADIKNDYAPAGNLMLDQLTQNCGYVQRRVPRMGHVSDWRIFKRGCEPY